MKLLELREAHRPSLHMINLSLYLSIFSVYVTKYIFNLNTLSAVDLVDGCSVLSSFRSGDKAVTFDGGLPSGELGDEVAEEGNHLVDGESDLLH